MKEHTPSPLVLFDDRRDSEKFAPHLGESQGMPMVATGKAEVALDPADMAGPDQPTQKTAQLTGNGRGDTNRSALIDGLREGLILGRVVEFERCLDRAGATNIRATSVSEHRAQ